MKVMHLHCTCFSVKLDEEDVGFLLSLHVVQHVLSTFDAGLL